MGKSGWRESSREAALRRPGISRRKYQGLVAHRMPSCLTRFCQLAPAMILRQLNANMIVTWLFIYPLLFILLICLLQLFNFSWLCSPVIILACTLMTLSRRWLVEKVALFGWWDERAGLYNRRNTSHPRGTLATLCHLLTAVSPSRSNHILVNCRRCCKGILFSNSKLRRVRSKIQVLF